jgi:hypothetical protein
MLFKCKKHHKRLTRSLRLLMSCGFSDALRGHFTAFCDSARIFALYVTLSRRDLNSFFLQYGYLLLGIILH